MVTKDARTKVDAFIAQHPGYTRDGVQQPEQGATNQVIFARRGDERVIFKVFCSTLIALELYDLYLGCTICPAVAY
ncbi:MAG: hypothetical protein ISS56_11210 [Anaerolineae bacterium]|nr:hypothetical protein [Anaerolineae bacterium]